MVNYFEIYCFYVAHCINTNSEIFLICDNDPVLQWIRSCKKHTEKQPSSFWQNSQHRKPEMITIRFAGWVSGRMESLQPDTDIQICFETGTGYGYPKRFYWYFEDSDFWKKLHIAQSLIYYLHSEAYFQPSVPWLRVCLWCILCIIV